MNRRRVVSLLGASAIVWPLRSQAQAPAKVFRIGILGAAQPRSSHIFQTFERRLAELGFVEGRNLAIEFRSAGGKPERFRDLADELVGLGQDVLLASGPEAALRAARQASATIPIVMVAIDYDPIALGYVAGVARPGGNITGVFLRQLELTQKRLELLKEAVPGLRRIAVLWDSFALDQLRAAESVARGLRIDLVAIEVLPPHDFERAFGSIGREPHDALLVLTSPIIFRERARIAELANKHRLPAMYSFREHADVGGLLAYGPNIADMFRLAAEYVDKIQKGARPQDLPIEQPTKFDLVVNLKTARALGISLAPSVIARADEVIE